MIERGKNVVVWQATKDVVASVVIPPQAAVCESVSSHQIACRKRIWNIMLQSKQKGESRTLFMEPTRIASAWLFTP